MRSRWIAEHLRDTVRIARARPDYATGLRAATATVLPLLFGELRGELGFVWMALGGWLTTLADAGGPYAIRARTMAAYGLAGGVVTFAGALGGRHVLAAVALILIVSVAAGAVRIWGDAASTIGTLVVVTLCVSLGTPAPTVRDAAMRAALLILGSLSAMGLSLGLWPVHAYRPVREAVGDSWGALRHLIAGLRALHDRRAPEDEWHKLVTTEPGQVRAALEKARITLASVRRDRESNSDRGERLVVLFELADRSLGRVTALTEALQEHPRPDLAGALRELEAAYLAISEAVPRRDPPSATLGPALEPARGDEAGRLVRELQIEAQVALEQAGALGREGGPPPAASEIAPAPVDPLPSLRDALRPGSLLLHHGLRVGVTTSAALLCGHALGLHRTHWITVSTVIVLQPSSGATVRRALGRVLGTILGATAAALIAPFLHGPLGIAAALFPLTVIAVALRPINFGLYAALVTPVFVLMAESVEGDFHLVPARIASNLLGGAFALLGAFLLWPQRERTQLPAYLAALLEQVRSYARDVLAGAPPAELSAHRRRVGLAAANAEASLQRLLAEPHREAEVEPAMAVLAWTRRLIGSLNALWIAGPPAAAPTDPERLDAALGELAAAAREGRSPRGEPPEPEDRVWRQISVLHGALRRFAAARALT